MFVYEICYFFICYKLGLMCCVDISIKNFCELVQEVGVLLIYEVIKDLFLEQYEIFGWVGLVMVEKIFGKKIIVVLILCVGIGMFDGVFSLIFGVKVSVVGVVCNEEILEVCIYLEKLVLDIVE